MKPYPVSIAVLFLLLFSSLGLVYPVGAPPGTWTPLAPALMERDEAPSAVIDGLLYVFGGFINSDLEITNTVEVYDPATDTWTMRAPMPVPVTHAGAARVDKTVWLVGGFEGNHPGPVIDAVQIYDTDADAWQMGPSLPEARASGTLVRLGRYLHYVGGLENRNDDVGNHYVLDLANPDRGWATAAPLPQPRNHLGGAAFAGKLYAIGGQYRHNETREFVAFLHVYDPQTDTWERRADLPAARSHFEPSTFVHEGRIFIGGGIARTEDAAPAVDHFTAYDPATDTWETLDELPEKLLGPVLKVVGGRLLLSHGGLERSYYPQRATYERAGPEGPGDALGFWPSRVTVEVEAGGQVSDAALLGTLGRVVPYELETDEEAPWLTVEHSEGETDASGREVMFVVDAAGLTEGVYTGTVTAQAEGLGGAVLEVEVTVTPKATAFQEKDGRVVIEGENYHEEVARDEHRWVLETPGGSVGEAMMASPNTGVNIDTEHATRSPELLYRVNVATAGTYYVWARVLASGMDDDSWHIGLDGQAAASADRMTTSQHGAWTWANRTMNDETRATLEIAPAGEHTIHLWMREDGLLIDRLVFTTDPAFTPSEDGPPESPRVIQTGTVDRPDAVPLGMVLEQNFPNPFTPPTSIRFQLMQAGPVRLRIYDVAGREVAQLVNQTLAAGTYTYAWDGRDLQRRLVPSGVYFYTLAAGNARTTHSMLLIK